MWDEAWKHDLSGLSEFWNFLLIFFEHSHIGKRGFFPWNALKVKEAAEVLFSLKALGQHLLILDLFLH